MFVYIKLYLGQVLPKNFDLPGFTMLPILLNTWKKLLHLIASLFGIRRGEVEMEGGDVDARDVRHKAYCWCRDSLHGSWARIKEDEIIVKHLSGGLTNYLYICYLPKTVEPDPSEPTRVLLRVYGHIAKSSKEFVVHNSVVFALLSEKGLGPKLYGIYHDGRIEEYIPLSNPHHLKKMGRYTGKTCRLLLMLVLTGLFFLVEIIVGYVTNSIALVADSFHMLSDVVALIVGFSCVRIARWPSEKNTFGWIRAEVLGALVNSVFLMALCFSILVEALKRLVQVEKIDDPKLMLIVGSLGLLVNLIGLALFHKHGHSHGGGGGHGHSHGGGGGGKGHGHSHRNGQANGDPLAEKENLVDKPSILPDLGEMSGLGVQIEIENDKPQVVSQSQLNMRGVFLHVLGDALGSVIVIISALVIWFVEGSWKYYVDPVMSILLVIIILSTTTPLLRDSSLILLQAVPKHIDTESILHKMENLQGVLAIHEFHVWQLAGNRIVATAHIRCQNFQDYMILAAKVKDLFHEEGIHSTTIQPELVEVGEIMNESKCALVCQPADCIPDTCCGQRNNKVKSTSPNHKDKNAPNRSKSLPNQSLEGADTNTENTPV